MTFYVWKRGGDWGGSYASTREDFDEVSDGLCGDYLAGRISLAVFESKLDALKEQIHRSLERHAA